MPVEDEGCDCFEVVESWLYVDSQGFRIPDSEWGRDLKGSLEHVLEIARSAANAEVLGG